MVVYRRVRAKGHTAHTIGAWQSYALHTAYKKLPTLTKRDEGRKRTHPATTGGMVGGIGEQMYSTLTMLLAAYHKLRNKALPTARSARKPY